MKSYPVLLAIMLAAASVSPSYAECAPGAYGEAGGDFVAVVPHPRIPPPGQRYLFLDGRIGNTANDDALVTCVDGAAMVEEANGDKNVWPAIPLKETDTEFVSVATTLAGRLIEPAGPADPDRPLVVFVHGSERTSALRSYYAYVLAAQGVTAFVYDKRGTGSSEGEYTQNFELLAEDAANALRHARELAKGRYGRSGFFGGSQGGWVAPLAATLSPADFVAVGFGLVTSPIEEDREQMVSEVRALGLGDDAIALINRLSDATSQLLLSNFEQGYDALARVRREMNGKSWASEIHGEHSGDMLRMDEDELRRLGRARFDNVELIWDYDAFAALKKVEQPLLWVLAGEDREAPIEGTREALLKLIDAGKPIDAYLFPDTDHGMVEFVENEDGSRSMTRFTDGYFRLLGDWIKGDVGDAYGRAERVGGE